MAFKTVLVFLLVSWATGQDVDSCNVASLSGSCPEHSALLQARVQVHTQEVGSDHDISMASSTASTQIQEERILSVALANQIPVANQISDATDYRAPPNTPLDVQINLSLPHPQSHSKPAGADPWPLYEYEVDSNGVSCVPSQCTTWTVVAMNKGTRKLVVPCGQCWRWDVSSSGTALVKQELPQGIAIHGHLEISDPGVANELRIITPFVLVTGSLLVANPNGVLAGQVTFHLQKGVPLSNPVDLTYVRQGCGPAAQHNCAIRLGHSVFAVVGGSVTLKGFPASGNSWYRLAKTAEAEDQVIRVDGDVSDWPLGGEIIVTSTEFNAIVDHTERRKIVFIAYDSNTQVSTISLDAKLNHSHWGETMDIHGYGKAPQIRAEVALLSRRIVVEGPTDSELNALQQQDSSTLRTHGGHFGIFFTKTPQHVEGVEFRRMGQQGTFGKYSFHMHLCQDHSQTIVQKNSVVDSKQRGFVIHGTNGVTLQENVAYNVIGHCFMLEDGYEIDTKFIKNLVANLKPPRDIPGADPGEPGFSKAGTEDDFTPSGFWITNINNWLEGNVVSGACTCAGCDPNLHDCVMCKGGKHGFSIWRCAGVWFKMSSGGTERVRKESQFLPTPAPISRNTISDPNDILPHLKDNVMHSNHAGFRYYNPGWCPKSLVREEGQTFYKNFKGIFNHKNQNFEFKHYLFLDNREALNSDQIDNMLTYDAVFVGVSKMSERSDSVCITTKKLKPNGNFPRAIQWDGHFYFERARGLSNRLRGVSFVDFDKECTDEDGDRVTPITIKLNAESVNNQDWVAEELEDISLHNTQRVLHFDPSESKGYNKVGTDYGKFPKLFPQAYGSGQWRVSWALRHRHFYVKNSPDLDPDTANGAARFWLPANHWQAAFLKMSHPAYDGCYQNRGKKTRLKGTHETKAWLTGNAPIYADLQVHQCSIACVSNIYFALRRHNNADPKSTQCICMNAQQWQQMQKKRKSNWKCDSSSFWSSLVPKVLKQLDYFNVVYSAPKNLGTPMCKPFLVPAENMMSCPKQTCPRILRAAWHLDEKERGKGATFRVPTALRITDQDTNTPYVQVGGSWSTSRIMLGDGTGNTGSKYSPDAMGTGGMSVLGNRRYLVQVVEPNGPGSDEWAPMNYTVLKLELYDAREAVPTSLQETECKIPEIEIDLRKTWKPKMSPPTPMCGSAKFNPSCQLSPTPVVNGDNSPCAVSKSGTTLVCKNWVSGFIKIVMP